MHIRLNQKVEGQTADSLIINGKPLDSRSVVWTAGVANNPFFAANDFTIGERGKVVVNEYLQAEPDIHVIGDNAATKYSGLAQTALEDALFVSANIVRNLHGIALDTYKPREPVSVIPVGPEWAAVEWGRFHFSGKLGWLLRSAADWIGYHDLQPWWKASEQWLTEFGSQEDCVTCTVANQQGPADILQRFSSK